MHGHYGTQSAAGEREREREREREKNTNIFSFWAHPGRYPETKMLRSFGSFVVVFFCCQNLDSCTDMWCKRNPNVFPGDLRCMLIKTPSSRETKRDLMFSENLRALTCAVHSMCAHTGSRMGTLTVLRGTPGDGNSPFFLMSKKAHQSDRGHPVILC
jgi:hypothetical protein